MRRLALTVGEPAGIGPDICLEVVRQPPAGTAITLIGDIELLRARAAQLGRNVNLTPHMPGATTTPEANATAVWHVPLARPPAPGRPLPANALSLLEGLDVAVTGCLDGRFDALVTAPSTRASSAMPAYPSAATRNTWPPAPAPRRW